MELHLLILCESQAGSGRRGQTCRASSWSLILFTVHWCAVFMHTRASYLSSCWRMCFLCVGADRLPGTDHSRAHEPDTPPKETPTIHLPETESIQVSWYQWRGYLVCYFWIFGQEVFCLYWHPSCCLTASFFSHHSLFCTSVQLYNALS